MSDPRTELVAAGYDATIDTREAGKSAIARALAERRLLAAVDLSPAQLRRVRERVPAADHLLAGPTTVEFPRGSLDAVAAFYVHPILGRT